MVFPLTINQDLTFMTIYTYRTILLYLILHFFCIFKKVILKNNHTPTNNINNNLM